MSGRLLLLLLSSPGVLGDCADPPTDDADATGRWCSTSCPGCVVKLFNASQSSGTWNASAEGIAGCVCAVVGDGVVLELTMKVLLSEANDCFVGVGSGQADFSWPGGLFGGGGDDLMCAGTSSDRYFYGGDGNDTMHAGDGNDERFYGGDGADAMHAGGGNDMYFYGKDGDDTLYAGGGNDTNFKGNNGNDALHAGDGDDTYFYGARLPPSARPRRAPAAAPSNAARATLVPQRIDADARRAFRAQATVARTRSTASLVVGRAPRPTTTRRRRRLRHQRRRRRHQRRRRRPPRRARRRPRMRASPAPT